MLSLHSPFQLQSRRTCVVLNPHVSEEYFGVTVRVQCFDSRLTEKPVIAIISIRLRRNSEGTTKILRTLAADGLDYTSRVRFRISFFASLCVVVWSCYTCGEATWFVSRCALVRCLDTQYYEFLASQITDQSENQSQTKLVN